jgi:hypothetical protein
MRDRGDLRADEHDIRTDHQDLTRDRGDLRADRQDIRADKSELRAASGTHDTGAHLTASTHGPSQLKVSANGRTGTGADQWRKPENGADQWRKPGLTANTMANNVAQENQHKETTSQPVHQQWYHWLIP